MGLGLNSVEQLDQHLLPLAGWERFEIRNEFLNIGHKSILTILRNPSKIKDTGSFPSPATPHGRSELPKKRH